MPGNLGKITKNANSEFPDFRAFILDMNFANSLKLAIPSDDPDHRYVFKANKKSMVIS